MQGASPDSAIGPNLELLRIGAPMLPAVQKRFASQTRLQTGERSTKTVVDTIKAGVVVDRLLLTQPGIIGIGVSRDLRSKGAVVSYGRHGCISSLPRLIPYLHAWP